MSSKTFEIGDETDQALTTTLVHEMFLCKASFEEYAKLAQMNIMGYKGKELKVRCHDAYARFLTHLYEFYVGCIQRDRRSLASVDNKLIDRMLTGEVRKLLRHREEAILNGTAPSWENHISVYQVEVPESFGEQFRKIRNRTAHASVKRSVPGDEITLAGFYSSYHKFVYLLFYHGQWLWTVSDIEAHNWRAIEDFDLAVRSREAFNDPA